MINKEKNNWALYNKEAEYAYLEAAKGNYNQLVNHCLCKNGEKEIRFAIDLMNCFWDKLPATNGRVLDVGCGAGYLTYCLKKAGFDPIGVDLSPSAIQFAVNRYPDIKFFQGDCTKPEQLFDKSVKFDLIIFREFHPFTRINDFGLQMQIIQGYINLLSTPGCIFICHARRGGGMKYKSLSFEKINEQFRHETSMKTAGPFFYFIFNHLCILPRRGWLNVISSFTSVMQRLTNQRWIEYFLIMKDV
jgi:SAM-dependent methyltransferase